MANLKFGTSTGGSPTIEIDHYRQLGEWWETNWSTASNADIRDKLIALGATDETDRPISGPGGGNNHSISALNDNVGSNTKIIQPRTMAPNVNYLAEHVQALCTLAGSDMSAATRALLGMYLIGRCR